MDFATNRSLLNPRFDGYKLAPLDEEDHVVAYPLPKPATQATVSGQEHISFNEVRNRVRHNHLHVGIEPGHVVYINSEGGVVLIIVNRTSLKPSFHPIFEIPPEINPSARGEYPSAHAIDNCTWLVSDGRGVIYCIRITVDENTTTTSAKATLFATFATPNAQIPACRIHSVAPIADNGRGVLILLSTKHVATMPKRMVYFDLIAAYASIPEEPMEGSQLLEVKWKTRGADLPIFTLYDQMTERVILFSPSVYGEVAATVPRPAQPDEIAPIPRASEQLDSTPPPPYSWTQTGDTVTVIFGLPSLLGKDAIHVKLGPRHLSMTIDLPPDSTFPAPSYHQREFWDGIQPGSSWWTWDKEGEKGIGLLSLHLDKQHEGTKWSQVFTRMDEEAEVLETLDPSELWHIREALEKYTATLHAGQDSGVGSGLGTGVPSLSEGEMDPELDSKVGNRVLPLWIGKDGMSGPTRVADLALLSTPMPGSDQDATGRPTLVTKNDIDGLQFALLEDGSRWKHVQTFPALAFVLASKRDTRFVFHIGTAAVFAFDSGGSAGGGNVYVYWDAKGAQWGRQAVLKMTRSGDALLGVGAIQGLKGETSVLCLCERELVILKGLV